MPDLIEKLDEMSWILNKARTTPRLRSVVSSVCSNRLNREGR